MRLGVVKRHFFSGRGNFVVMSMIGDRWLEKILLLTIPGL
jgi:hypothetical protein